MIALAVLAASITLLPAADGEALFTRNCVGCHGPGGWGTRRLAARLAPGQPLLLTDRRDLDPGFVAVVVRQGIGPMPPFRPTDLSANQIRSIAAWLTRRQQP